LRAKQKRASIPVPGRTILDRMAPEFPPIGFADVPTTHARLERWREKPRSRTHTA
jgi:hypothetical protein